MRRRQAQDLNEVLEGIKKCSYCTKLPDCLTLCQCAGTCANEVSAACLQSDSEASVAEMISSAAGVLLLVMCKHRGVHRACSTVATCRRS